MRETLFGDAPLTIRHDAIWGYHANVTPAQLAKIARYFCAADNPANVADELHTDEKTATRLHAPGLHFIVFPDQHRASLLKDLAAPHSPLTAAPEIIEIPPPYHPPVLQFLTLKKPEHPTHETPPDHYQRTLGITPAHIPELLRLYKDPEVTLAECAEDSPVSWTRIHAQRALYEHRAHIPNLARLLLDEIIAAGDDAGDYIITTDAADLLAQIGAPALPLVIAELHSSPACETNLYQKANLAETLPRFAERDPRLRPACLEALCKQLEDHPVQPADYNGFLVSALLDLDATEAAPLIERAYLDGNVDDTICGYLENVLIKLGLKEKRTAPLRRHNHNPFPRSTHNYNHPAPAATTDADAATDDANPDATDIEATDDDDNETCGEDDTNDTTDDDPTGDDLNDDITAAAHDSWGNSSNPYRNPAPKIGRNDPCPCGSGKKYKKCCMDKA